MTTTETISLIAAFSAIGTAVFLPAIKSLFGFQGAKLSDSAAIRKYMQEELAKRDIRIDAAEQKATQALAEAQKWRDLYYEQRDINSNQASQIIVLRADNQELNEKVNLLQALVSKNAGIVQDNADNVSHAMVTAKEEIKAIK